MAPILWQQERSSVVLRFHGGGQVVLRGDEIESDVPLLMDASAVQLDVHRDGNDMVDAPMRVKLPPNTYVRAIELEDACLFIEDASRLSKQHLSIRGMFNSKLVFRSPYTVDMLSVRAGATNAHDITQINGHNTVVRILATIATYSQAEVDGFIIDKSAFFTVMYIVRGAK